MRYAVVTFLVLGASPVMAQQPFSCRGTLIDQRVVGVSLGECDLNSLSETELRRITAVCGPPNGVDETANHAICTIRALVFENEGAPGVKVTRVLSIRARR
ncbi:hypothetical protein AAFX91_04470 [Bradyrhizobium sp. 31Argb]|uniref:hypothetical protein n=1 Tax=Bradyrhizobium sp. 31Argb TaxID=3141247 RepID=UPI003748153E